MVQNENFSFLELLRVIPAWACLLIKTRKAQLPPRVEVGLF
jgi:hypothetical protein